MNDANELVFIEQKLDAPKRLLFFTADDAAMFLVPTLVGFLSKHIIGGVLVGLVAFGLWRRLKGEGGLERLKAAAYWFLPYEVSPYRSFPKSDVVFWRG